MFIAADADDRIRIVHDPPCPQQPAKDLAPLRLAPEGVLHLFRLLIREGQITPVNTDYIRDASKPSHGPCNSAKTVLHVRMDQRKARLTEQRSEEAKGDRTATFQPQLSFCFLSEKQPRKDIGEARHGHRLKHLCPGMHKHVRAKHWIFNAATDALFGEIENNAFGASPLLRHKPAHHMRHFPSAFFLLRLLRLRTTGWGPIHRRG